VVAGAPLVRVGLAVTVRDPERDRYGVVISVVRVLAIVPLVRVGLAVTACDPEPDRRVVVIAGVPALSETVRDASDLPQL
jgi:hypothetical protein